MKKVRIVMMFAIFLAANSAPALSITTSQTLLKAIQENQTPEEKIPELGGKPPLGVISKIELEEILQSQYIPSDKPALGNFLKGLLSKKYLPTQKAKSQAMRLIQSSIRTNIVKDTEPDDNKHAAGCWTPIRSDNGLYLLMVENIEGGWSLPGGLKKKNETGSKAALREAAEETGFPWKVKSRKPMKTFGIFDLYDCQLANPLDAVLLVMQQAYTLTDGEGDFLKVKLQNLNELTAGQMRFKEERLKALRELAKE